MRLRHKFLSGPSRFLILLFIFLGGCTRPQPGDLPEAGSPESPLSSKAHPSQLAIRPFEPALLAGSRERLSAEVLDDKGSPLSGYTVLWHSNNPGIASIDSEGRVTAHAPGEVLLSASLDITFDAVKIYVFNPPIQRLEIRPSIVKIRAGDHQAYTVFASDSEGRRLLGLSPEWFSTRPSIARVDSGGGVTGLRAGTTRIGARVDEQMVSFRLRVLSPG